MGSVHLLDAETKQQFEEAIYRRANHRWLTFVNVLCMAFTFAASAVMGITGLETGAQAALVAGVVLAVYSLYDGVQAVRWARRLEDLKERTQRLANMIHQIDCTNLEKPVTKKD